MVYCVVKTSLGKSFMVELGNTEEMQRVTVDQLKTKIFQIEGIPEHRQKLLFEGKQLEDGKRLFDYGIQPESEIWLVIRLRGGGMVLPETDSDDELRDREGETRRSREKLADFRCCLM